MNIFNSGGKLHWIKNYYLRLKRGGGCCDVFNLDYYLARKILKPLKAFRGSLEVSGGGYPVETKSMEEWLGILDKMIFSFQNEVDGNDNLGDTEKYQKVQEGFELFGKYYQNLWI